MNVEAVLSGCVVQRNGRDIAVCAMQEAGAGGRTSFHVLLGSDWFGYEEEPEWPAVSMAGIQDDDLVIVAVAADGRTWELNPASKVERLARVADGHCGITRLAALSDAVWACGMGRVVWRRDGNGMWTDLSAPRGTLASGITGFTGIGETEPGRLLAVGWQGEIWLRTDGVWRQEDSPSNSNFNNISVGPMGDVVVVGDRGGLVVGGPGQWTAIDSRTDFNLQGVCHFAGETFVCTDFEIFRLVGDKLLRETRFIEDKRPATCMNLMAGGSCLYSQGERDLFRFQDGVWANVL